MVKRKGKEHTNTLMVRSTLESGHREFSTVMAKSTTQMGMLRKEDGLMARRITLQSLFETSSLIFSIPIFISYFFLIIDNYFISF